jgi:multidrug efflux system outer membrane protein
MRLIPLLGLLMACLFAQGLVACASAPVREPAAPALPESFREPAQPADHSPALPDDGWWRVFQDEPLDALVREAARGNPGLQQAAARVARAAAALGVRAADASPQLNLAVAGSRQVGPLVNAAGSRGNLFSADARLSLDLDPLHRLSRTEQAAAFDLRAQQAQQRHAQLLLQAEVASTELERRAVRQQQATLLQALDDGRRLLAIAERRVAGGLAAPALSHGAQAELQADELAWQALERRQALLSHALAALLGRHDLPEPAGEGLPLLPAIPPGLPSQLLQRRADLNAAEQALQAARLRSGLARDSWFPQLTLTADAGVASGELSQWLRAASRNAGLGLLLNLPGLDGGRADALRAAAAAEVDLATAEHREKVLAALREVDDQLTTLRTTAGEARARQTVALDAARDDERASQQVQRGLASESQALQAHRQALRLHSLALQAQSAQHLATVALVRALGGGWGESPPPTRLSQQLITR